MHDQSSADAVAAIQILAQEIINEINAPVCFDLSAKNRRAALWGNTAMSSSALGQEKNRARTNHVHHGCH